VKFEVLTAVLLKIQDLWDVTIRRVMSNNRRLWGVEVFLVQDQIAEYEGIIIIRNVGSFIPSPSYASLNKIFKRAPIYFTCGNEGAVRRK